MVHTITLLYIELTISFSDWQKVYNEFSKSVPVMSSNCRLYDNHVKDTQGHRDYHVMYDRVFLISEGDYVKFARCIQCIIKELLDSVFVISRIIMVSVQQTDNDLLVSEMK